MNPCPCGYHGHPSGRCRCTPEQISRYRGKISGPLLDRIDMRVECPACQRRICCAPRPASPARVRERVEAAFAIQLARQGGQCLAGRRHAGRHRPPGRRRLRWRRRPSSAFIYLAAPTIASCGWRAPSPTWKPARRSTPAILPKLFNTVAACSHALPADIIVARRVPHRRNHGPSPAATDRRRGPALRAGHELI